MSGAAVDAAGSVVVGYDGSSGAKLALRWAVEEAAVRTAPLRLTYIYQSGDLDGYVARHGRILTHELDLVQSSAHRLVVKGAAEVARISKGGVKTTATIEDGNPVESLLRAASTAALIVLGSRHLGVAGSMLLGSTSAAVAARSTCPVVVMRGPAGDPAEGAPVVAGVDPDGGTGEVLDFAFDYAHRHRAPLVPVMCWHVDPWAQTTWGPQRPAPARADVALSDALSDRSDRYPNVQLHPTVRRAHPVHGLVDESTAGRLLVIGSHGRHALAGALLGSVSQGVLHHATCPVAVVPINVDGP